MSHLLLLAFCAQFMPASEGATWTYSFSGGGHRKVVLAKIERGPRSFVYVLNEEKMGVQTSYITLESSSRGLFLTRSAIGEYTPPLCEIKLPLIKGMQWESKSSFVKAGTSLKIDATRHYAFFGFDNVATAAGKFPTICIHSESPGGDGTRITKSWYAKSVGLIKTEYYTGTLDQEHKKVSTVLSEFKAGK